MRQLGVARIREQLPWLSWVSIMTLVFTVMTVANASIVSVACSISMVFYVTLTVLKLLVLDKRRCYMISGMGLNHPTVNSIIDYVPSTYSRIILSMQPISWYILLASMVSIILLNIYAGFIGGRVFIDIIFYAFSIIMFSSMFENLDNRHVHKVVVL